MESDSTKGEADSSTGQLVEPELTWIVTGQERPKKGVLADLCKSNVPEPKSLRPRMKEIEVFVLPTDRRRHHHKTETAIETDEIRIAIEIVIAAPE
jgi:hypothetical protein